MSITQTKTMATWSALPGVLGEQIFSMIPDCESVASAAQTCRSWEKFLKGITKEGTLNLTIYPSLTDREATHLFSVLKKAQIQSSLIHQFFNLFLSSTRKTSFEFRVTSINLTGFKEISDKTLQSLQKLPITILDINHCPKITGKGLKALQKLPLIALGLDGTKIKNEDLLVIKDMATLQVLNIRSAKKVSDLSALKGTSIEHLDCSGTKVKSCAGLKKTHITLFAKEISTKTAAETFKEFL